MIIVQILFLILALLLSPVVLLFFFIQSRHPLFYVVHILFLLIYGSFVMLAFDHYLAGLITFGGIFLLQQIVYILRWSKVRKNQGVRYIAGFFKSKESKFKLDFIVSLVPLYFVKNLPWSLMIHSAKSREKINVKQTIGLLLEHGKDTSIDVDTREVLINFKIA